MSRAAVQVPASASLIDRWYALYDGLLASSRFRRWAAGFALTRPLARRRARALFDVCAGFVYSQVLLACVRLRLFDVLAEGPKSIDALAVRAGVPYCAMERLLRAAVGLRLVSRRSGGRYGLGALGAAMVDDEGIAAMVEHHAMLYQDLDDPVALLRRSHGDTALSGYWPYADRANAAEDLRPERLGTYSALMSVTQPMVTEQVLSAYALDCHDCLMDVGGGEGVFLCAAACAAPTLRLMLFDLPVVAELASARFAAEGLGERATAIGGDFRVDELPAGADAISLIRILFDHDDETALSILRAARRALPVGGTVLVAEPLSGSPGSEAIADAYFGFYLLAMGRGRTRTVAEHARLFEQAGFTRVRQVPTRMPFQAGLITAVAS